MKPVPRVLRDVSSVNPAADLLGASGKATSKALALGAYGILAGRAPIYGLAIVGEAGVARALAMLEAEFVTSMGLLGARTVAEIDGALLTR